LYWNGSQWQWDIFGLDFAVTTNGPDNPWDAGATWDPIDPGDPVPTVTDEPCP